MSNAKAERKLVWIDLEMTGLNPLVDLILEISAVITDNQLNMIAQGPTIAIHYATLPAMSDWVMQYHTKNGLFELVKASTISLQDAQQSVLAFVQQHCKNGEALLCGNTIWQDRFFLRAHMPLLEDYMHYRMIDVSTIKELVQRWYPNHPKAFYQKKDAHRALDDVFESIDELRHYRTYFFVPNNS